MLRYPERVYTSYEVNIGYYPYRAIRDVEIKVGPGPQFDTKEWARATSRLGWQSVRNPNFLRDPGRRPERNGYVWVFKLNGGHSGWVPRQDLMPDYHDSAKTLWADGPASCDFQAEWEDPKPKRKPRFTIGHNVRKRNGRAPRRRVASDNLYFRYSAHGTAFHYLLKGDVVSLLHWHPRGYMAVQVVSSRTVPQDQRGWVLSRGLEKF